jgi:spore coat protein A
VPTYIRWENHIEDAEHILPIDETLTRAIPPRGGVPLVPHLHGAESAAAYDGHPDSWFTMLGDTGPKYSTQDYIYLNSILPQMLWYHDHSLGITRANVVAGLAGPYIIRGNDEEEAQGLPHGNREILLILQDKHFFADGSINFPNVGNDITAHPRWCPGYYGDTIVVNGKVWPYLDVLPLRYRLRILNAASDRYFSLSIDNMTFYKIGSDGGYLSMPVVVDVITLAPAGLWRHQ